MGRKSMKPTFTEPKKERKLKQYQVQYRTEEGMEDGCVISCDSFTMSGGYLYFYKYCELSKIDKCIAIFCAWIFMKEIED